MKISQEDTLGRENFNKFLETRPFIIQWILPNVRKIVKKGQSRPKNRPESYSEAPAHADFRRRENYTRFTEKRVCVHKITQGQFYNNT